MSVDLRALQSVSTWEALAGNGYTRGQILAELAARRWQRAGYAIVRHNGPLTREERWHVARVHGGPGAVLTGFTAAAAYGLRGWDRPWVDVLVRPGAHISARSPVPLKIHRVLRWESVRVHSRFPVQSAPQAILLAASTCPSPRSASGLLAASVQQKLVTVTRLSDALAARPNIRHRRILVSTVGDIGQGADALSEIDFVRLCRRFGLPAPVQQAIRREPNGRCRYLDATFRRSDGALVVAEVDGALHLSPVRWWDDQRRQNELAIGDALVLRFPSVIVRTQPELVAEQLYRMLRLAPPRRLLANRPA